MVNVIKFFFKSKLINHVFFTCKYIICSSISCRSWPVVWAIYISRFSHVRYIKKYLSIKCLSNYFLIYTKKFELIRTLVSSINKNYRKSKIPNLIDSTGQCLTYPLDKANTFASIYTLQTLYN